MSVFEVRVTGTVESRILTSGLLKQVGDLAVVLRGVPRLLIMLCPCGCGEELTVNLDPRSGKAWRLYWSKTNQPSLFPSVWRDTGCGSHFILWRGRIWLFDVQSDDFEVDAQSESNLPTDATILNQLDVDVLVPYAEVADRLGAIPWDVLWSLRRLTRLGRVAEGAKEFRGSFRRVPLS